MYEMEGRRVESVHRFTSTGHVRKQARVAINASDAKRRSKQCHSLVHLRWRMPLPSQLARGVGPMAHVATIAFLRTTAACANAHRLQSAAFPESLAISEPADSLQLGSNSPVPDCERFQWNGCGDISCYTSACHLDDFRAIRLEDETFDFHFVVL